MRAVYSWVLLATVLITIGVTAWDSQQTGEDLVQPVVRANRALPGVSNEVHLSVPSGVAAEKISEKRPSWAQRATVLAPALRDIFARQQPVPTLTQPAVTLPPAALPEQAPSPNLRFLGRFVSPAGVASVYLTQADEELEAKLGETLPNGYVVESFTQEELHLVYPLTGTRVVLSLGAEP